MDRNKLRDQTHIYILIIANIIKMGIAHSHTYIQLRSKLKYGWRMLIKNYDTCILLLQHTFHYLI